MSQLLFLRIYRGSELVLVKQIQEPPVVLGKTGEATVRLDGDGIAPIHAMIEEREQKYFLCDLGSETGTFKNGASILDDEIQSGDEIRIGPFRIEFFVGLPKPKAPPPKPAEVAPPPPKAPVFPPQPSAPPAASVTPAAATPPPAPITPAASFVTPPSELPKPPATPASPPMPPKKDLVLESPTSKKQTSVVPPMGFPSAPPMQAGGMEIERTSVTPPKGAFTAPGEYKDLSRVLKPSKGTVVEVAVTWGDRILSTHHFDKEGMVHIGSHPSNEIILPVFGSPQIKHPILKIDSFVTVLVSDSMSGEHYSEGGARTSLRDYIRQKRLATIGGGFAVPLQQAEMIRVDFGRGLSVYIRFVADTVKPLPPPFFDLTTGEFMGILATFVIGSIMGLYMAIYSPEIKEPEKPPEPERKAQFLYKPKQEKIKVEMADNAGLKELPKDPKKTMQDTLAGAASEAAPNKSQSQEKKLTATRPGQDKGITKGEGTKAPTKVQTQPTSSAAKVPEKKDVSREGLLSVFGRSGTQEALRKSNQGAGLVGGLGQEAKGEAAAGAGTVPGLGMKEVGQGGQGVATVGIAGVKTKGRGGGLSGYGTGTLGDKERQVIVTGGDEESFTPGIDKEGIRRVIIANQRQIKACYEKGLNQDPGLHGKVILEWEIGDRGRVLTAKVKSSTLGNSTVEQCMVSRLKTWVFPEPPGDQVAVVAYPFVFLAQQ